MKKRKAICVCGFEARIDNMPKHQKSCVLFHTQKVKKEYEAEITRLNEKIKVLSKHAIPAQHITNNNINIVVYGTEELPEAYDMLKKLCQKGNFEHCVPRYVEMKHFPIPGKGNIRFIDDKLQIFSEKMPGEYEWVDVNKDTELENITERNMDEIINRYGNTNITNFHATWVEKHQVANLNSENFKTVAKNVENTIRKNS